MSAVLRICNESLTLGKHISEVYIKDSSSVLTYGYTANLVLMITADTYIYCRQMLNKILIVAIKLRTVSTTGKFSFLFNFIIQANYISCSFCFKLYPYNEDFC